jgi:hypothetical protein
MAIFNSYVRLPEGKLWDVLWMEIFAEVIRLGSLCSANAIRTPLGSSQHITYYGKSTGTTIICFD